MGSGKVVRLITLTVLLLSRLLHAHLASDSFLNLKVNPGGPAGKWDLPVLNLVEVLPVDDNQDKILSSDELERHRAEIAAYALSHFTLISEGKTCAPEMGAISLDKRSAGTYAVMEIKWGCEKLSQRLNFAYSPFFDRDPQHKGYLNLNYDGQVQAVIFSRDDMAKQVVLEKPSVARQFTHFLVEGIWHIWLGFDHILFLMTLLLPAVLVRRKREWVAPESFRTVFTEVLKVVTAFTIAHSVTLCLAALQIVSLPARFVESTIAASVVLSALNNLFPVVRERRWLIAFVFGFIHGFGFANVLGDLGLPPDALAVTLFGFNLGVEIGQLAIVVVVLPALFWLRRTLFYRRYILGAGSGATAFTALLWFIERVANLKFMPF